MRVIVVVCLGIFLIASTMTAWYITQPLLMKAVATSDTILTDLGENSTESEQTFTIVGYFANLWPIPIVVTIILWMFISGHTEDPYSKVYGG